MAKVGPNQVDEDTNAETYGAAIANVTGTAGATYTTAEQAIVNSLVTTVNAMNAVLKQAGLTQQD